MLTSVLFCTGVPGAAISPLLAYLLENREEGESKKEIVDKRTFPCILSIISMVGFQIYCGWKDS